MDLFAMQTLAMIVGEYDYSKNFVDNPESTWAARLLFLIFMLDMAIVLMNLVLGLAVSDIDQLQKDSAVQRMLQEAMVVIVMENALKIFQKCPIMILQLLLKNSRHEALLAG